MTTPVSSVGPGAPAPLDPASNAAALNAERAIQAFVGLPHGTTSGSTIDALQRSLNVLGASPVLGTDGVYGKGTEGGVRDYLARDLPELALGAGTGDQAASRPAVKRLQRALNILTNAGLEADGKFGSGTEAAVAAWQTSLGLNNPSAPGTIDRGTWNALLRGLVTRLDTGRPLAPAPVTVPSAPGTLDALQPPTASGVSTPGSATPLANNVHNSAKVASGATFGRVSIRGLGQWYLNGRGTVFGGGTDPKDKGMGAFGFRTGRGGREGAAIPQRVMAELTGSNDKSVHQQYKVEVLNRATGRRKVFDIVDRGPGERIWREAGRATVDLTEGAVADIGGSAIKNRSGTTIAVSGIEDLAFRIIRG